MKANRNTYWYVSPRGFANEVTLYRVPANIRETFCEWLDARYGADPNADYGRTSWADVRTWQHHDGVTWADSSVSWGNWYEASPSSSEEAVREIVASMDDLEDAH